jgi:predicted GIY-YIG superfamily endonuclease
MVWETDDYREAARLEYYIKKMKRPQKEQLIAAPDAVALLVDERLTAEYRPHPEVTLEEMV